MGANRLGQSSCQNFPDLQIQQTPDLTSLDPEYLPEGTLAKLPHLCKLKEKLYSRCVAGKR